MHPHCLGYGPSVFLLHHPAVPLTRIERATAGLKARLPMPSG